MTTEVLPATDQSAETPPTEPIATPAQIETLANAMAQNTHQHAAATPEDAPAPVQRKLPIPRPALDHNKWNKELDAQWTKVLALNRALAAAKSAAKHAQTDYDDADGEFRKMWARYKQARDEERAYQEAVEAGEQLALPHGAECAWEREHPGQVCAVCAEAREAIRAKEIADAIEADAAAEKVFDPQVANLDDDGAHPADHAEDRGIVLPSPGDDVVVGDPGPLDDAPVEPTGPALENSELPPPEPEPSADEQLEAVWDQDPEIVVGTSCLAKVSIELIASAGDRGVCFDVHDVIEGSIRRPGYGFIFENGSYGTSFSPSDVRRTLVVGAVVPELAAFKFRDDRQLEREFRTKAFHVAFPPAEPLS